MMQRYNISNMEMKMELEKEEMKILAHLRQFLIEQSYILQPHPSTMNRFLPIVFATLATASMSA